MNGYSPQLISRGASVIGAGVTKQAVSKPEGSGLTSGGSKHFRVNVKVTDVTVATGITLILQHLIIDEWKDLAGANASVAVTADGTYSLTQAVERSADQPNMPVSKQIRVVCSTGAGDAVTVQQVELLQEL